MSLTNAAAIGSLISALAVLISLIYLARQFKQAQKHQRGLTRTGRVTRLVEASVAFGQPSMAEAVTKGMLGAEDITSIQLSQFTAFCRASF